jgi:phospholipid transport system substrate-binding protein
VNTLSLGRALLSSAALILFAGGPALAEKPPAGPMAQLKQSNERIDRLLKRKKGADEPAARTEMKSIVNGFLDYDELAKRSLSQHWEQLSAGQRDQFIKTLRELIEKNYVKQLRSNLDYAVEYKGEEVTGDDAKVGTVVKVRTTGKSTDTDIDYRLHKVGEKWLVYDVVTDEVSMVKNYRSQFHKIITEKSFDELLGKMKKRIAETDAATTPAGEPAKHAAKG